VKGQGKALVAGAAACVFFTLEGNSRSAFAPLPCRAALPSSADVVLGKAGTSTVAGTRDRVGPAVLVSLAAAAGLGVARRQASRGSCRSARQVKSSSGTSAVANVSSDERREVHLQQDQAEEVSLLQGSQVCAVAAFVSSAKSVCEHPDRKPPYLCGDCPRNGFVAGQDLEKQVCAAAAFVSSAKAVCEHPDRKEPYLCGDCPRNSKMPGSSEVCAAAAFVSSAKAVCEHPDRKPPYLCGDCPRNGVVARGPLDGKVCAAAAFVSSAKSVCEHPDRKEPYLCGDCPRNSFAASAPEATCAQAAEES